MNSRLLLLTTMCLVTACILLSAVDACATQDIDESRRNAIVRAVEKLTPTVVSINVLEIQRQRVVDPFFNDFFRFFDLPRTRVRERQVRGIGSGFIFDPRGYILTNYHVIENADRVTVTLPEGRNSRVQIVGSDRRSDLAVLKIDGDNLPVAELGDSDGLMVGEWMIALGNPFGLLVNDPKPSVSVGVVSANHRRVSRNVGQGEKLLQDLIQTDAAINPGNSGGPLANARGEVVGINTLIFSLSGGNVGLGFAIPINRAKRVAQEIIDYGRRLDPWPGFTVVNTESGAIVFEIIRSSPAYEAGLRAGDIIININGSAIEHPSDVDFAVWSLFVGDDATLTIDRDGERKILTVPIQELR